MFCLTTTNRFQFKSDKSANNSKSKWRWYTRYTQLKKVKSGMAFARISARGTGLELCKHSFFVNHCKRTIQKY